MTAKVWAIAAAWRRWQNHLQDALLLERTGRHYPRSFPAKLKILADCTQTRSFGKVPVLPPRPETGAGNMDFRLEPASLSQFRWFSPHPDAPLPATADPAVKLVLVGAPWGQVGTIQWLQYGFSGRSGATNSKGCLAPPKAGFFCAGAEGRFLNHNVLELWRSVRVPNLWCSVEVFGRGCRMAPELLI